MKYYLVFILLPYCLLGQETPYYKKPENRTSAIDRKVLPNLNASETKIFVFAGAGLNTPKSHVSNNSGYIKVNNSINTFFDFGLGINKNYDWKISLAYEQFNFFQYGIFQFPVYNGQRVISYEEKIIQIPLEYSKRIVYLNRVSKAAYLNFNLGISYLARNFDNKNENRILAALNLNQKLDTLNLNTDNHSTNPNFLFFGGLEIGGKIIKFIDIGLIYKLNYKPNGLMQTDVKLSDFHNFNEAFSVKGNNLYSQFELRLIWNFEVFQNFEKHY